jgi:hypothetical protein
VRIVPREEGTFQSACLMNHRIWDATAFNFQKINKTVDRASYFALNQRITTHHANIFSNACGESRELPCRIFSLIGERRLERDPSIDNVFGALAFFPIEYSSGLRFFKKMRPVYTHQGEWAEIVKGRVLGTCPTNRLPGLGIWANHTGILRRKLLGGCVKACESAASC